MHKRSRVHLCRTHRTAHAHAMAAEARDVGWPFYVDGFEYVDTERREICSEHPLQWPHEQAQLGPHELNALAGQQFVIRVLPWGGGQSVHKTAWGDYMLYHHYAPTFQPSSAFCHNSASGNARFYRADGTLLFVKQGGAWEQHLEARDLDTTFMGAPLHVFASPDTSALESVLAATRAYIDKLYQPVEASEQRQAMRRARQAAKKLEAEQRRIESMIHGVARRAVQNVAAGIAAEYAAAVAAERAAALAAKRAADAAHEAKLARLRQLNKGANRRKARRAAA
jgi:hypothetical protein